MLLEHARNVPDHRLRRRIWRAVRSRRAIDDAGGVRDLEHAQRRWSGALENRRRAGQTYETAYRKARRKSTRSLRSLLDEDDIRRALLWQNRRVVALSETVQQPDVLIGATSPAELAQGHCILVLGEVHASLPSTFQAALFSACREQASVREAFHVLAPSAPVLAEVSQRLNLGDFFPDSAQLLLPDEPVTHVRARPVADFDMCHGKSGIRIRDVTNRMVWTVPVFFDAMLSRATLHIDAFDRPHESHSPRIRVGELVVSRETWRVRVADIGITERRGPDPGAGARHFLAVRAWARQNDVPRYVFIRSLTEPKPMFLDLESQACIELLGHVLRRTVARDATANVVISEMLPEPERAWLRDRAGHRYVSELRFLAVDPIATLPPENHDPSGRDKRAGLQGRAAGH